MLLYNVIIMDDTNNCMVLGDVFNSIDNTNGCMSIFNVVLTMIGTNDRVLLGDVIILLNERPQAARWCPHHFSG